MTDIVQNDRLGDTDIVNLYVPAHVFEDSQDKKPLFENMNITLSKGQFACVMGRSGVGKSTLIKLLAGLISLPPGSHRKVPRHYDGRDKIALLAQDPAIPPWLSVLKCVTLGSRLRGEIPNISKAKALLRDVGLADVGENPAHTLSGGMKQRVALARTLYEDADLVLLDEPFSALDALTRIDMQSLTKRLLSGKTVFMITHDPDEALAMTECIYVLKNGHLRSPKNPIKSEIIKLLS